jgi:hypothetical protein
MKKMPAGGLVGRVSGDALIFCTLSDPVELEDVEDRVREQGYLTTNKPDED